MSTIYKRNRILWYVRGSYKNKNHVQFSLGITRKNIPKMLANEIVETEEDRTAYQIDTVLAVKRYFENNLGFERCNPGRYSILQFGRCCITFYC